MRVAVWASCMNERHLLFHSPFCFVLFFWEEGGGEGGSAQTVDGVTSAVSTNNAA